MPSISPFTRPLNTCVRADLTRLANHFHLDDSGNVHALRKRLKTYLDANADILASNMTFSALFSSRDRTRLSLDAPPPPRDPTAQSVSIPGQRRLPSPSTQLPLVANAVPNNPSEHPMTLLPHTTYNTSNNSTGTIYNVHGDLHSNPVNHYYGLSSVDASFILPPFNDAPIDRISSCFTGRELELEFITTSFHTFQSDKPTRFVIYGMPGLGKSQLALQHANLAFTAGVYSHIFCVSASTVEKLSQGLARILGLINHPDRNHPDQAAQITTVRLWFEQSDCHGCRRWLLILDDVTVESAKYLREHLPGQNAGGNILITTRTCNIAESVANVAGQEHIIFKLEALSKAQSVNLLLRKAGIQTTAAADLENAEKLVSRIGCLPLAVEQAGSYMKRSGFKNADRMQRMYGGRGLKEVISWQNNLTNYEETSILAAFTLQFQKLDEIDPDAHRFLKTLAFFDPENIPIDILSLGARSISDRIAKIAKPSLSISPAVNMNDPLEGVPPDLRGLIEFICSEERVRAALHHFEDLSIAQPLYINIDKPSLHIHDLIQWVLQQSIVLHRAEGHRAFAIALLCHAFQTIDAPDEPQSWAECERYVPHFTALGAQDKAHPATTDELMDTNHSIARYFKSRGRYKEAESLLDRVLADHRNLFGSNDIRTLNVMHLLARVCTSLGKYQEAEPKFLQVLAATEEQLGADHPDTLTIVNNLASLYESQGRFNEAESLYGRALAGKEKQLGTDHPATLVTVDNLARLYKSQGRFNEAEGLYGRALAGNEKQLGADHPDTLATVNNLAMLYQGQGRFNEAESLYGRALAGKEKQLGADHPDTLVTVANLASLYQSQGRFNEAESLYGRALAGSEKQLGADHPSTLITVHHFAHLRHQQGKYHEAELLYRRALAGQEAKLGPDHPDTQVTRKHLAGDLDEQGRYEEADELQVGEQVVLVVSDLQAGEGIWAAFGAYLQPASHTSSFFFASQQVRDTDTGLALIRRPSVGAPSQRWWRRASQVEKQTSLEALHAEQDPISAMLDEELGVVV
ncbi:TPR-like protein [Athelia psychrophila]|uniref:TPR-like protein n=1 Tax=Athelia psychrophila TaxID=1759441 RepID=A0A166PWF0_9AGAM|nr:TPR-like protein [Fibularhizoctonia sp. CBS 109695]